MKEVCSLPSKKIKITKHVFRHVPAATSLELFAFLGHRSRHFIFIIWGVWGIFTLWPPTTGRANLFISIFFPPEEFQSFVGKLPTHYAVNTSAVEHLWRTDAGLLQRHRQLETRSNQLSTKARRTANKLFSLSKRCRKQPKIVLQRQR